MSAGLAPRLAALRICYRVSNIVENGVRWVMQTFESTARPAGPTLFIPHDTADTAFEAAVYSLGRHGGRLVTVHTGEQRTNSGVDALPPVRLHRGGDRGLSGDERPSVAGLHRVRAQHISGRPAAG